MADTVNKLRAISEDEQHAYIAEAREKGEIARSLGLGAARDEGRRDVGRAMLREGADRAFVARVLGIPEAALDAFLAER